MTFPFALLKVYFLAFSILLRCFPNIYTTSLLPAAIISSTYIRAPTNNFAVICVITFSLISFFFAASAQQALSQACVSGVAKLHWRNHVVQNLRACFILYAITIKWTKCVQEKIELSSMSRIQRLCSTNISGDLSLFTNIKQL